MTYDFDPHSAWDRKERKRVALKQRKQIARKTPLKRTGISNRQTKSNSPTRKMRRKVMARAGGRCEAGIADDCTGVMEQCHHRLMRSQGGKHELDNLLGVCGRCHAWIHAHPRFSYETGYLIRGGAAK